MKKLILLISLFMSIETYAQVKLLADSSAIWYVDDARYFVNGDSVVGSTLYKKYYRADSFTIVPRFHSLMREDPAARKIFVRYYWDSIEALLYDFSLAVGDSVSVYPQFFNGRYEARLKVDSIDSILVNGSYRLRYLLTSAMHSGNPNDREYWIEGIGSLHGVFESGTSALSIPDMMPYTLICYSENNVFLYKDLRFPDCYRSRLAIDEHLLNDKIKIFPNPASLFVNIESEVQLASIKIVSIKGQTVASMKTVGNRSTVDLSQLPPGVYALIVETSKGSVVRKILVE